MTQTSPSLSFDHFVSIIHHANESLELLATLEKAKTSDYKCPPPSSVLVTQILSDLYNEASSDEANINRITTNLEAAANDILMMSKLIRNLRQTVPH
jgi:hypothetical protein